MSLPVDAPRSNSLLPTSHPFDTLPRGKIKQFDPYDVLALERWQDYVFALSLSITVAITAKRIIVGDIPGVLAHSTISVTIVMGKIYTDDSCNKLALSILAKTLGYEVVSLQNEVKNLTDLTEQQRDQLSQLSYENHVYGGLNREHANIVRETQDALKNYENTLKKMVVDHEKAIRDLQQELKERQNELHQVTQKLEQETQKLEQETQKLEQETQKLEQETQKLEQEREKLSETERQLRQAAREVTHMPHQKI